MSNSNRKSIANLSFAAIIWRELDWTRMIILAVGTALVALFALTLSQLRPLIMALERLSLFEVIAR